MATAGELHARLRRVPAGASSVMLIGHNPALHDLVSTLVKHEQAVRARRPGPPGTLEALREKFPTGALATLTFMCAWSEIAAGCAGLSGFVRRRGPARESR